MKMIIKLLKDLYYKYSAVIMATMIMSCGLVYACNPERFADVNHAQLWGIFEVIIGIIGILCIIWVTERERIEEINGKFYTHFGSKVLEVVTDVYDDYSIETHLEWGSTED